MGAAYPKGDSLQPSGCRNSYIEGEPLRVKFMIPKKKRSPRYKAMSDSWLNMVLSSSGCNLNKKSRRRIERLWHRGFSHKDASAIIKQQMNAGEL